MYYKEHSADWWRRSGIILYRCSFFILVGCVIVFIFLYLNEIDKKRLIGIACGLFFELAVLMLVQGIACRLYMRNALIAEQGEQSTKSYEMAKINSMMFWAWFVDTAVFMVLAGVGLASSVLSLCVSLPILFSVLVVSLALAIVHTKKSKVKSENTNENRKT